MSEVLAAPSLGELLRDRAATHPGRAFLRFEGREVTLQEADQRTDRVASWLRTLGVQRGDRVGVMLPNGLDFPLAWLGIAKAGAVMVPLNVQYQSRDLAYTAADAGVTAVLADPRFTGALHAAGVHAVVEIPAGGLCAGGALAPLLDALEGRVEIVAGPDDLLNIQYTSGTTGEPKGCMLTHEYWMLLSQRAATFAAMTPDDVALTAQPFYYMDPQWNVGMCLVAGCPLVILPRFSASTFWRSVKESGTTFLYVLGTMPVFLLKQPADPAVERGHRVRFVSCSGIVPQLHREFEARWGIPWREAFGMTETGVDLVVPVEDGESVGSGAVGRPVEGKEARVVDAAGAPSGEGEVGELCVRGRGMMAGYWNKPDATAERIRDGWLHTGDLAWCDARGYYHLVGRLKDMIRRGGENIAAAEVEGVLAEHPAVRAAAVVPVPDELRGEEVKAFVQRQPGMTVEPADLVAFVRGRLAAFKAPRYIEFIEDFPRTPSERIAKHRLVRDDQTAGCWDARLQPHG